MNEAILAAVQYTKIRLLRKPRLVPWVTLVELGDERLQLRSAESFFTLGHRFLIDIFYRIRSSLDGRHTVEEISAIGGADVQPTTIIFLLQMLQANGLLQEGEDLNALTRDEYAKWERQIWFLAHFLPNAAAVQTRLSETRVAILGSSELKDSIRLAVESIGVGHIRDLGESTTRINGANQVSSDSLDLLDIPDLLIACEESSDFLIFDAINTACLESGTRWMRVAIEGTKAFLGPTIVPHQTACYTCYDRRVRSHTPDPDSLAAYRKQVSQNKQAVDEGMLFPLWSVVAGQVALEVARILTGFAPPVTIGRLYELGVYTPEAVGHTVLRLPRCPSCGLGTVRREAWDQALSQEGQ